VLEHFSAGHRSGKEAQLARQVHAVEWIETGGELGALLVESRLVKDLQPSANRRLRKPTGLHCVRLRASDGMTRPCVEPFGVDDLDSDADSYGPFRTERDAWRALEGKAREAGLCLKVMGLEPGPGSCFALQLGRCRGACVGSEAPALHDARLRLALASLRVRRWPFPGPVGIREPAPDGQGTVLHVVDRWQHIGTARDDPEVAELLRTATGRAFDPDAYRIVARCLERAAPRDLVMLGRGAG
jgi:DNA polymerase-3 subunit epsilon